MPSSPCYRFSRFELDLIRGCLREGDRDIKLRPKAFAVLRCLVEQAGRLLSKDELMAVAWPGIHVSDDSLVQCIREIRRVLDDDDQACIKTVTGRGYLFAAPVAIAELSLAAAVPPAPAMARTIAQSRGPVALGIAVTLGLGVTVGVLSTRWLDPAPRAMVAAERSGETPSRLGNAALPWQVDDTRVELAYWQSVQATSDPRDFQSYLDAYPNGMFTALARNRLRALEDSARTQAQQRADDMRRLADAPKAEASRVVVDQRQAAALQRQAQAEAARRRTEADRVGALEAEVRNLRATVMAPPPIPAPPPAAAPEAAPAPTASPQLALAVPPRANREGDWAGELGSWRFSLRVQGNEISGSLSCGNNIYRLRGRFAEGYVLDTAANRVSATVGFPTTIGVKGDFPRLRLEINNMPWSSCTNNEPFDLRPVLAG